MYGEINGIFVSTKKITFLLFEYAYFLFLTQNKGEDFFDQFFESILVIFKNLCGLTIFGRAADPKSLYSNPIDTRKDVGELKNESYSSASCQIASKKTQGHFCRDIPNFVIKKIIVVYLPLY